MSFRELTMTEAREVIRPWQAEQGMREMARATRLDRIAAWLSQQKPLRLTKVHTLVPLGVECTDGMCRL